MKDKKWSEESIRKYLEEHPEINTRRKLKDAEMGAYHSALRKNLLDDLFGDKYPVENWSEEQIRKFIAEHPEIDTKTKFRNKTKPGFRSAVNLGIIDELFPKKVRTRFVYEKKGLKKEKWTRERILEYISEHPEIKTRGDFFHTNSSAYKVAIQLNMLEELFGESLKKKPWTEERLREYLAEHPEIKTDIDFRKQNSCAYYSARINNLLDKLGLDKNENIKPIVKPTVKKERKSDYIDPIWPEDKIRQYLFEHPEIKNRSVFHTKQRKAYEAAKKQDLLDELFEENNKTNWTEKNIRKYIEEHPEFKQRVDFQRVNPACYRAAKRLGLLDEYFGEVQMRFETREDVLEFMSKHPEIKTRMDLNSASQGAYNLARKLNMLDDICERVYNDWTKENILNFIEEHPEIDTRGKFQIVSLGAYNAAKKYNILDELFPVIKKEKKESKPFFIWTDKKIIDFLKEHPEITSTKELREQYPNVFYAASKRGITVKIFGEREYQRKYSEDDVRQFMLEHPEIKTRSKLQKVNQGLYNAALRMNLLDDFFGKIIDLERLYSIYVYEDNINHFAYVGLTANVIERDFWHRNLNTNRKDTLQMHCIKYGIQVPEVKILKDNLTPEEAQEWEKKMWYKYRDDGWNMINSEDKLGALGVRSPKWTRERVIEFRNQHPEIKTRKEFCKKFKTVYEAMCRFKINDLLFPKNSIYEYWTRERVIDFVRNEHPEIKTITALDSISHDAYLALCHYGLKRELFPETTKAKPRWTKENIAKYISERPGITKRWLRINNNSLYKAMLKLELSDYFFPDNKTN